MNKIFHLILLACCIVCWTSCSTEVNLNAPAKEIWVVYGVLNPEDSVQYIRVANGFLPEGDALEYAKENDLSAKGLLVNLRGANKSWEAVETNDQPKDEPDGLFFPNTTLYKFETTGTQSLESGETYELEILQPGKDDFVLRSQTGIPEPSEFFIPNFTPGPGRERCLRVVDLVSEYKIEFSAGGGKAFEIRAFLDYEENFVPKTAVYGPTDLFTTNVRCQSGATMCYQFREKEIITAFFNDMDPQDVNVYTYAVNNQTKCSEVIDFLPDAFRFEITSMDQNLASYQLANDPSLSAFNTVKPEFTNIEGPNGMEILGIFGSINKGRIKARLDECGEYLLHLNETPRPLDCQEL
ncbi:MAG: hypothetical protein AAF587_40395 [Bacteroidota bacterium]